MNDYQNWGALLVSDGRTLLEHFNDFMGFEDNSNDDQANRALDFAGNTLETYLDRVIAKREVLEQFPHHFGTVILHHPQVDPNANVTVYLNGVEQSGYNVYLEAGGLAHLTRTEIRPDIPMDWRPYDQVGVTYTAGYDPLPNDLAYAIIYTAQGLYTSEGTGTAPGGSSGAVKSMAIYDVGSISYDVGASSSNLAGAYAPGVIPDTAAQMAARYKRMMV